MIIRHLLGDGTSFDFSSLIVSGLMPKFVHHVESPSPHVNEHEKVKHPGPRL